MKGIPREAKKQLSDRQYKLVIGTLLGDACFLKPYNWGTNYRLQIGHSKKQKDYVFWKYKELKDWVRSKPKFIKGNQSWRFRTRTNAIFSKMARDFYVNGKKIIPNYVFDLITDPLVLAVWYMDDGGVRRYKGKVYNIYLNTQSFTKEEVEKISDALLKRMGILSTLEYNRKRWRLRINNKFTPKFLKIVNPYILSGFNYKIL